MGVKAGYKITDIGLIPSDWGLTKLGMIANVIGGGTPSSFINSYWNGDINWFTPTEIGKEKYSYQSIRKISKLGFENCSAKMLPVGTILLTTRAGIGDVSILMQEGCTNQGFQSFVVKNEIDNEYLYYVISTLKNVFLQNASGSTFLEISPNKIRAILVPLPPTKAEQTAIATALSNADALINSLEKLIAKKRNIKQGAMQKLLKPKKDWEIKKMESLTKVFTKQTGFDYTAYIKPSLTQRRTEETIPFIQNKDFNNKWINFNTDYFIPRSVAFQFPKILLNEKSLLISISGSVGNIGVYDSKELAFIGGAVAILKFKESDLIDWVMFYLKSDAGQRKLMDNVKAGSHQNLILDDIRKIEIPFPSKDEQSLISTILSDMDEEMNTLETKLEKYKKVKLGMMQNLLTGKIRLV